MALGHRVESTLSGSYRTSILDSPWDRSAFALKERDFYREHSWCLNIYPTVADSLTRLRADLDRCIVDAPLWLRREILTNIYLHLCAVADTTDDFLIGTSYDLSYFGRVPFSRFAITGLSAFLETSRRISSKRLSRVHRWRHAWGTALLDFLKSSLIENAPPSRELILQLKSLTHRELPSTLLEQVAKAPAAYRSQDLSHLDILALGKQCAAAFDDRYKPLVIIGLRTAGSYFAPLLAAYLQTTGFSDVDFITLRPKKGIAPWEQAELAFHAKRKARAILVDEPVNTGGTLLKSLGLLQETGFRARVSVVVPIHANQTDWRNRSDLQSLTQHEIVGLQPEHWYKRSLMQTDQVAALLREWLGGDSVNIAVSTDEKAAAANRKLEILSERKFHDRLKRVFRVDSMDASGNTATRYVLAKGVGWGWYGYHAVLISERLSHFVPPLIGYRNGILFEEWLGDNGGSIDCDRAQFVHRAADYIAERARTLQLDQNPVRALAKDNRHKATDELAATLSYAYGSRPAAVLRRAFLREWLVEQPSPPPVIIDGKMRPQEWVAVNGALVKTDFEQHGLGKTELNALDPAYDLGDVILQWDLSEAEENSLIERYTTVSGDKAICGRLHLYKILAGLWTMMRAFDNLDDSRLCESHGKFNRSYLDAWTFLTLHTARLTGALCRPKLTPHWHGPVVVMDVDGVIDRQIFGFPSTTAAGIRAISLLHAHGYILAINTARSVTEMRDYCKSYRLAGGVAEYGAYAWDPVGNRGQVLVSSESLAQIELLADRLRRLPGVFLNDDYKYSIRAFTYQNGGTTALSQSLIQNQISLLKLDRLVFHQTLLDTAVMANETDKGTGLLALLSLAGHRGDDVTAIGDSEPDLPMFRVANSSYAPGQIKCRNGARLLGCRIVRGIHQLGLLEATRHIVHNDGRRCGACKEAEVLLARNNDLFVRLLQLADHSKITELVKAVASGKALASLRQ